MNDTTKKIITYTLNMVAVCSSETTVSIY